MSWKFWCTNPTKAARRYTQRLVAVMAFYMVAVFRVTALVREHHPTGGKLYFVASLPTLPVLAMLAVVGMYLREEVDEFKRQQVIVSMLWATAVTLALGVYTDFLRSYSPLPGAPPFTMFVVFWIVMGIVSAVQSVMNRVKDDE